MSKQKNKPTPQTVRMAMPKGDVGVGFMSIDILVNERNKIKQYLTLMNRNSWRLLLCISRIDDVVID
jgi:hypothetical protein